MGLERMLNTSRHIANNILDRHEALQALRAELKWLFRFCTRRYLGKAYNFYREVYIHRKHPIVVYQMAKVGSTSVQRSLRHYLKAHPSMKTVYTIHQTHFMNLQNLHLIWPRDVDVMQEPSLLWQRNSVRTFGKALRTYIVDQGKPVKIITLVRDPIGRNFSSFFFNLGYYTNDQGRNHSHPDELTDIFIKKFRHSTPLVWFDVELKHTLGIDIYEHPFPQDQGWGKIQQGNIELLVMKAESDDCKKAEGLSSFLGWDRFSMIRKNSAEDKDYAQAYRNFVQNVQLPASYIETMYHSKLVRHFYSPEEIEQFRAKWLRGSSCSR